MNYTLWNLRKLEIGRSFPSPSPKVQWYLLQSLCVTFRERRKSHRHGLCVEVKDGLLRLRGGGLVWKKVHAFFQSCKSLIREYFQLHLEMWACRGGSEAGHAQDLKGEGTPWHGGQVFSRCWIWQSPQEDTEPCWLPELSSTVPLSDSLHTVELWGNYFVLNS